MVFAEGQNRVFWGIGGRDLIAELSGVIKVDATGAANGQVSVTFDTDESQVLIQFAGDEVTLLVGDVLVDLRASIDDQQMAVNGDLIDLPAAVQASIEEINEVAIPADWSAPTLALAAIYMLTITPVMAQNIATSRTLSLGTWGCKMLCATLAAIAVGVGVGLCASVTAGCAGSATVTLGGTAIPCAYLIPACAGGVFLGGQLVMITCQEFWSTAAPPPTS
jgi:hypothetical protein